MSKKLAEGSDHLILDVKVGSGAFMKTREQALELAQTCIQLGVGIGRNVRALITQMDQPLGAMVGNALEVRESIEILQGGGPQDVRTLTLALAEELLEMCGLDPNLAQQKLDSGEAFERFCVISEAHGADPAVIRDPSRLPSAPHREPLLAPQSAYISALDAFKVGKASSLLGAGRAVASDPIDPRVGFELVKKVGERVERGEPLAWIEHAGVGFDEARLGLLNAYAWSEAPTEEPPLIYERVTRDSTTPYRSFTVS